ncbi:MAG: hypothetical protein GF405_06990, partial [Candidatus Eisenbacteria bacterium]|nr:hypothetical protein [Candidatus Eisenbacteria bacterium]
MTARSILLVIAASLILGAPSSHAGVVRVPQDEPTISAGISEASPGDTVLIASGTYDEHSLNVTKGITIAG